LKLSRAKVFRSVFGEHTAASMRAIQLLFHLAPRAPVGSFADRSKIMYEQNSGEGNPPPNRKMQ